MANKNLANKFVANKTRQKIEKLANKYSGNKNRANKFMGNKNLAKNQKLPKSIWQTNIWLTKDDKQISGKQ